MEKSRARFIHDQNVANYTRLLGEATDTVRRQLLVTLLREELAAARAHGWGPPPA